MSQENVQIVLSLYDAFTRRDNAAPFEVYAPDIEVDFREGGGPDAQAVSHGHEGVRNAFRNWLAPFRSFEFRPEEVRDIGDHVLVKVSEHGIGRASGVVVDRCHWALWTLHGGKVVSLRNYYDHAEALKAAGLE